jgi:hypothetical protein
MIFSIMNASAGDCQINRKGKEGDSDKMPQGDKPAEAESGGKSAPLAGQGPDPGKDRFYCYSFSTYDPRLTLLLFPVDYLLQIDWIIKIRAVRGIMAFRANRFIHLFQSPAHVGVAFRGPVTGFTLDVFQISLDWGRGPEPRRMAGKTKGVVRFPFICEGLVSAGMGRRGPLLMLLGMAGLAGFLPHVSGGHGNDDVAAEGPWGWTGRRPRRGLSKGLQACFVLLQ